MTFPWWVVAIAFVLGFLVGAISLYYGLKADNSYWGPE